QCLGEDLDARSDVYSCGALFYELVTGEAPFTGAEPAAVLKQHVVASPGMPSSKREGLDARVDAIVRRALAKDPADRFASMRELRAALRELSGGLELPPQPVAPTVPVTVELDEPDVVNDVGTLRAKPLSEIRELREPK